LFPRTYSFAGGNLQDLGREAYGAFDTELLVLGTVDEIGRDWSKYQNRTGFEKAGSKDDRRTFFQILDIATSERDANLVDFSTDGTAGFAVIFFTLSDVAAHVNREPEGDYSSV